MTTIFVGVINLENRTLEEKKKIIRENNFHNITIEYNSDKKYLSGRVLVVGGGDSFIIQNKEGGEKIVNYGNLKKILL